MVACVHTFVAVIAVGLYMLNDGLMVSIFTLQLPLKPKLSVTCSLTFIVVPFVLGVTIVADVEV